LRFAFNNDSAISIPKAYIGFKDEIKTVYSTLGISSHRENDTVEENGSEWVATSIQKKTVSLVHKKMMNNNLIPDVTGMGLKDALYLLENAGLKVTIQGMGKVKKQSLNPGATVVKGNTINLILG
jgi:cell division protein FtsI (penicillin-binding protein 3)